MAFNKSGSSDQTLESETRDDTSFPSAVSHNAARSVLLPPLPFSLLRARLHRIVHDPVRPIQSDACLLHCAGYPVPCTATRT